MIKPSSATLPAVKVLGGIAVLTLFLAGCAPSGDQFSGSSAPRDLKGYRVDPVYGTRAPGQYNGF